MFTALLAKAVNPLVDVLSLQAGDSSAGAYDARSLAKDVVFPFQATLLGNVLDGSNSDPLVNKPGRYERLRKTNAAAAGDPRTALNLLCDNLPLIRSKEDAMASVDYIVSGLLAIKTVRDQRRESLAEVARDMGVFRVRQFMSDLLDQGFGGAALVIITTAVYGLLFPGDDYTVIPHPANQSGRSKRQFSDLDLLKDGRPFMGTELKDKPFTAADVAHAAETAYKAGASSLLFVAGRQSTFASQPPTYFIRAREEYAAKGIYVGVTSIDSLMDTVLASQPCVDSERILESIRKTAEVIGSIEAQLWIYEHLAGE